MEKSDPLLVKHTAIIEIPTSKSRLPPRNPQHELFAAKMLPQRCTTQRRGTQDTSLIDTRCQSILSPKKGVKTKHSLFYVQIGQKGIFQKDEYLSDRLMLKMNFHSASPEITEMQ